MSATTHPCKVILRVAATSRRQCHVTRRIQRLHAIDASVMTMRAVRATVRPDRYLSSRPEQ
jgi:hypothetical protein